jgi:hypothetical protein
MPRSTSVAGLTLNSLGLNAHVPAVVLTVFIGLANAPCRWR